MASRKTKFTTGLFVLSGLLIAAIIIIWAGASDIFLKGSLYNVYFNESVQGLQVDSAVKYRGVEIGKVESIKVAPDNTLIEVVMKIELSEDLEKNAYAQLKTAGITGIVFIELDRISRDIALDFREVPFRADHPVIPSRRSETSRFLTDANNIIQNIKAIDFKGISEQLKASAKAVETLVADKRFQTILTHLENTSVNLESASANLDKSVSEIKGRADALAIEGVVTNISDTLSEARGLVQSAKREVEAMRLPQRAAKAGEVLDGLARETAKASDRAQEVMDALDRRVKAIAAELQDTSENLRVTSENLEALSESLKDNPSELIYSRPAPPKKQIE